MKELKVCMLIDVWSPVYGGGTDHVIALSKRLVEDHGCHIDIYTRKLKDAEGRVYDADETHLDGKLNVYRTGYPTTFSSMLGRLAYTVQTPFKLREDYDVIHAHAYYAAYPARIIKALKRIPLIFTIHGIALKARKEMDTGFLSKIKSFMEDVTLFKIRYDCQISVDSSIKEYGNVNRNIVVIPNGVDIIRFDSIGDLQGSNGRFRIIYVGRLHPQKGLKYLIEAAKEIVETERNIEFCIIGSGSLEKELRDQIERNGLEDYFIFMGRKPKEDLPQEYKRSDLFVLPSLYEGQPLTLLEAWAAKLPVVVTDVGGNSDFVRDGVNGYIVEPANAGELARAIKQALSNRDLPEMGVRGYELVKNNYTWEKVAERTFEVYRKLVDGSSG